MGRLDERDRMPRRSALLGLSSLLVSCAPASRQPATTPKTPLTRTTAGPAARQQLSSKPEPASSPAELDLALYRRFPALSRKLTRVRLAEWPTPVERLDALSAKLGLELYVKRDDLAGMAYGGNKLRKLEFLLGAARAEKRAAVLTFGGVGSNHCLATTVFAKRLGIQPILMLLPEPLSDTVREHVWRELALGAEVHLDPGLTPKQSLARVTRQREGDEPGLIPPGGTSALGNLGYVNAALELAEQVRAGELPAPDVIYVTAGTLGTTAGLAVGLAAAELESPLVAVRASSTRYVSRARLHALFKETTGYLSERDSTFPDRTPPGDKHAVIRDGYVGRGYALPTRRGSEARALFRRHSQLELDDTYTAKTASAIVAEAPSLRGKVVLFWHTFDRRLPAADSGAVDVSRLPAGLRGYLRQ